MDPIEHLRALRDESRWTSGEVDLNAAPRPASAPAPGWRHWWPRITVATVVCAALVGLVIATLVGVGHTTNFAPGPASTDSAAPVVSPTASPTPSPMPTATSTATTAPAPVLPSRYCDSSDLVASVLPGVGGAMQSLYKTVMLMNSGPASCEITAPPTVQWARMSGSAVTPIGPSGEVAPGQSTQPRLILQPGAIAYVRVAQQEVDPTDTDMVNGCQPTPVYGIALTLRAPDGSSSAIALPLSEFGFSEVSKGDGCGSATESFLSSLPAYLSPDLGTTSEGLPNCTAGQLRAALDDPVSGAAGTSGVEIVLTNTSDSTCSLGGPAGVVFVGHGNGTQLGAPATPQVDAFSDVTLAPGKSAYEVLLISNPDNRSAASCRPVTPDGFQVTPPGDSSSLFVPFTRLRACTAGATQLTTRALTPTPSLPH